MDVITTDVTVPVLWWRAVGSTHTAYSIETFIDELAETAGRDPVEFRMAMLARPSPAPAGAGTGGGEGRLGNARSRRVAAVASRSTNRSTPTWPKWPRYRSRRLGAIKVKRVVCAVDCGVAVNPDVIAAQMEGGIGYGLGAILHDAITLEGGRVVESNFHDYIPLRIDEMPTVEVHIVPSTAPPTGVGEPGVPPIGPAVANAIAAATGKRIRSLPMSLHDLGTS